MVDQKRYVAGNAHEFAVVHASAMVEIALSAFPELSDEAKALMPDAETLAAGEAVTYPLTA